MIAGRYDLEREIGRGGTGPVWLARDTVLGREVALKRIGLLPGAQSADVRRAEREARLAARLNHPHVVAVFDLVEDDDDTWLVMEYVEGVTLSAVIKDGALLPDEAAPLVRQAADALAAAHAVGIVHRDVKPSNMMVTPAGEVKLTDFGIARAQADAALTRTGLVTGSPAYLAPEVASGASATEASDVWSLGATLYHALAGHTPYDVSDNLMGALYRIVHEEPPRLADPGWLGPALEHTMCREPRDRWSMGQVRDFLARGPDVAIHPAPFGAVGDDGTQVLHPTPSEPVAVPPVTADPQLHVETAPEPVAAPVSARRRSSPWPWVAAAAVLVALGVIAFAAWTGVRDTPTRTSSSGPSTRGTTGASDTSSPASPQPGPSQTKQMEQFLQSYLATVTSDHHKAWTMLTPAYQQASGGFGSYVGFWSTISSASPSHVTANPAAMTVTYDVAYVKADGEHTTEHHTLQLTRNGSSYLINDQLS
ncbi:MAG: serine/threonine protein kinase [Nocardioides sp.]|nr:serine/threonine protein kinase [Nocardioides sp.]